MEKNIFMFNMQQKVEQFNKKNKSDNNGMEVIDQYPSFSPLDVNMFESASSKEKNKDNINQSSNNNINKDNINQKAKPFPRFRSDYLYQDSEVKKNKIKNERNTQKMNIKKQMTPQITTKAQNIKRDPNLFSERLYPKTKTKTKELCGINSKIYMKASKPIYEEHYDFKPKINKNSLNILAAKKDDIPGQKKKKEEKKKQMQSSMILDIDIIEQKYKKILMPERKMVHKSQHNSSVPKNSNKNKKSLYERGIESMKKRDKDYNENLKERELEYLQYKYKPQLIPYNAEKLNNVKPIKKRAHSTDNKANDYHYDEFYNRNAKWKQEIDERSNKIYNEKEKKELDGCTFAPKINQKMIKNDKFDNKFIRQSQNEIVSYAKQRQNFLKYKEEEEQYQNKIPSNFPQSSKAKRKNANLSANISLNYPHIEDDYKNNFFAE